MRVALVVGFVKSQVTNGRRALPFLSTVRRYYSISKVKYIRRPSRSTWSTSGSVSFNPSSALRSETTSITGVVFTE